MVSRFRSFQGSRTRGENRTRLFSLFHPLSARSHDPRIEIWSSIFGTLFFNLFKTALQNAEHGALVNLRCGRWSLPRS